jgi:segregation and condensation protein B
MNVNALEIVDPRREGEDAVEQPMMDRLAAILESLLFAAGAPVPIARLVQALDGHDRREVAAALRRLSESYERDGRGLRVVEVAGGFQIRTVPEHGPWVRRLLGGRPPRLSRPMLETLAIIAYRQPCTRPEIEAIRGVDVDAVITTLLERRMIRIVGRKEAPGRPILYGTTADFLEVFGLPDLEALPPLRDLGELADVLQAADLSFRPEGVVPTGEANAPPPDGDTDEEG